ncbi:MAG TPA: FtsW/RodA/SpoVE family cell cycle protein [Anaerolineales bacterium]
MFAGQIQPLRDQIQGRLLALAAIFLGLYSLTLTLAPAARARSWEADLNWDYWVAFLVWSASFLVVHHQTKQHLPKRDPYIVPVAALLTGWGMLTVWRIFPSFGLRQSLWLLGVIFVFLLGLRLPSQLAFLRSYKYLWLTGGLILTALTIIFGTNPATGSNPRLWLGCCGVYFQPSEPLKLLLIVYLSAYLSDRLPFSSRLLSLLGPTLIMTGLTLVLLVVQRDLGTATIFLLLYTTIIYVGTGRRRILVIGALTLGLAGTTGYLLFDVVRLRVDAWLNPWLDPSGRSYQIVQSLFAVANGGLLGRGPGMGNPGLVPVPHSDFIFSAIAEETGLIGAAGVLILLAVLAGRGLHTAMHAPDRFRRYLAAGLIAYLVGQSVLIIGGNLRLMPLTGVTLPFVSYGGSSLLTAYLSLLILLHISNHEDAMSTWLPDLSRYSQLGGFLFTGLAAAALVLGWWAFYRSPVLLERTDNPRRAIADRFVPRGDILDRNNNAITTNQGVAGEYVRHSVYPELGPIVGYTHPIFGQSGLEASLDAYLRGLRGNPGLTIWWNHLLYGQPPPGLDLRLTLDLNLQHKADEMLADHQGALVLLNADTGDILAIASHPTFDPNQLDQNWTELIQDPKAPLFNRATLGRYPPGTAIGPLLLAATQVADGPPPLPQNFNYELNDMTLECAISPPDPTWEMAVANGCPASQLALGQTLGERAILNLYQELGFYDAPVLQLPTDALQVPEAFLDPQAAYLGLSDIAVSPVQMALAASTLSGHGIRPAPRLASAINTLQAGWVVLPTEGQAKQVFPAQTADQVANTLAAQRFPVWQTLSVVPNGSQGFATWYVAGTLPSWNGTPLTLAILLEDDNPNLAEVIGMAMLQAALQP